MIVNLSGSPASDPLPNADRPQFLVFVDETEKLGGKVIAQHGGKRLNCRSEMKMWRGWLR
jgi:hypothetical protein